MTLRVFLFKKIGLWQTCTISQKSRSHLKILARIVIWSKFLPDDLRIFDANIQNLVDTATWCQRICASLVYGVNTSACSTSITFQTLCGHSWHCQFTGLSIKPLKSSNLCAWKYPALSTQGGSNMTGTDLCVNKPHMSRSYLNQLVHK